MRTNNYTKHKEGTKEGEHEGQNKGTTKMKEGAMEGMPLMECQERKGGLKGREE
jgi:hypothetical protein